MRPIAPPPGSPSSEREGSPVTLVIPRPEAVQGDYLRLLGLLLEKGELGPAPLLMGPRTPLPPWQWEGLVGALLARGLDPHLAVRGLPRGKGLLIQDRYNLPRAPGTPLFPFHSKRGRDPLLSLLPEGLLLPASHLGAPLVILAPPGRARELLFSLVVGEEPLSSGEDRELLLEEAITLSREIHGEILAVVDASLTHSPPLVMASRDPLALDTLFARLLSTSEGTGGESLQAGQPRTMRVVRSGTEASFHLREGGEPSWEELLRRY